MEKVVEEEEKAQLSELERTALENLRVYFLPEKES